MVVHSATSPRRTFTALMLVGALVAGLTNPVSANAFLGRDLVASGLQADLLSEIKNVVGHGHRRTSEAHISMLEGLLRHTFVAMPKSEKGTVGHVAVRYMLHRLFVQRHGWFVRGLEPGGEAWNTSVPIGIFEEQAPEGMQELFDQRLGAHDFSLHDVAVMAATLEHLVHVEAVKRVDAAYSLHDIPVGDTSSQEQIDEVIDTYMLTYVMGENISALTPSQLENMRKSIDSAYPNWPETQKFTRDVRDSTLQAQSKATFNDVVAVVEEIGDRYGSWQDGECRQLKAELVALEDHGTGRVRLADFYGSAINDGKWQFSESADYLRQLGALDESDPASPSLIIANYINSPSNCVASLKYYSVCCLDECEGLMDHVESAIGAPDATSAEIARVVAALPSATVPANRTLPAMLRRRLDEIAQTHGDRVPLHGRLFAQWMHHAYPRECSYPHVSGTINPKRAEDFQAETGFEAIATAEEMQQHLEMAPRTRFSRRPDDSECTPWTTEEEFFVPKPSPVAEDSHKSTSAMRTVVRGVAFVTLLASVGLSLAKMARPVFSSIHEGEEVAKPAQTQNKYYV